MQETTFASTAPAPESAATVRPVSVVGEATWPRLVTDVPAYIAMFLVGFIFIVPFVWMFLTSFKPTDAVFRTTSPLPWKTFIPPVPTVANYVAIFGTWNFQR